MDDYLGIGMLLPVYVAAVVLLGVAVIALWACFHLRAVDIYVNVTAAGAVVGESVAGLAVAVATLMST